MLMALCLLCAGMTGGAEGYLGSMQVVNCEEWVSLRVQPDQSSNRLLKVPLGAIVENCYAHSETFTYAEYEGLCGFIMAKYLSPVGASFTGTDWLDERRAQMTDAGCLLGVALISDTVGGDWWMAEEMKHLRNLFPGMPEAWQPTLYSIPEERVLEVAGGRELYLIVPADADAQIAVIQRAPSDGSGPGEFMRTLYISRDGAPFLLRCNAEPMPWAVSDALPSWETPAVPYDCEIQVMNHDGEIQSWYPYINFYSGEPEVMADGVQIFNLWA